MFYYSGFKRNIDENYIWGLFLIVYIYIPFKQGEKLGEIIFGEKIQ